MPEAFFPNAVKKVENPTWLARRLNIRYSSIKLRMVANTISGLHIYDAISTLNTINKKGAIFVSNCLENARSSGMR